MAEPNRLVPYSRIYLWRGERMLGGLHRRDPAEQGQISGFLVPAYGVEGLRGVSQHRIDSLPGAPVDQRRVRPFRSNHESGLVGDDARDRTNDSNVDEYPLTRGADGLIRGAPVEVQLSLRDEMDWVLPVRAISFRRVKIPPGCTDPVLRDLPAAAIDEGWLWSVTGFGFDWPYDPAVNSRRPDPPSLPNA
jgi:hypothetical protein